MNINLEYYKTFYYVCTTGSITAAAEVLCISQPAVSQSVKQLESLLGARLFLRTAKGMRMTKEGELLFRYVSRGMDALLDGERMLKRLTSLDMGDIRIGASDMTLQFYLLPFLEQFHNRYPNVRVMVSNAPTPETLKSLSEGKIDFGLVSTPLETERGLVVEPVKEIRDIFVAGSRFAELKGRQVDYESLSDYPCIVLEKHTSTRLFLDDFLTKEGVVLQPEFELATSDMIVQFAARNLGIGCVMAEFAEEKLKDGTLFSLEFKQEMPVRQFCIVTEENNPISPAGNCLLEMMRHNHSLCRA